jgi:hypothetical protein
MIVIQGINGRALGQESTVGMLQQRVDFNCKTACWGIGAARHSLFKDLQAALNRYSGTLKVQYGGSSYAATTFEPIVDDGFIGPSTVAAAQKAQQVLASVLPSGNVVDAAKVASKEAIAANAPMLVTWFKAGATTLGLSAVAAPSKPPTVAEKDAHDEAAAGQQEDGGGGEGGGGWMWWVLGIVAVAGIGTVGYLTWKRNQAGGYEEDDYSEGPVRSVAGPRIRHSAAHMAGPRMSYARRAARY